MKSYLTSSPVTLPVRSPCLERTADLASEGGRIEPVLAVEVREPTLKAKRRGTPPQLLFPKPLIRRDTALLRRDEYRLTELLPTILSSKEQEEVPFPACKHEEEAKSIPLNESNFRGKVPLIVLNSNEF